MKILHIYHFGGKGLYAVFFLFQRRIYAIYTTIFGRKKGGITFTGNKLGLSKAPNSNSPGTEGSIGAFTSLNNSQQVGTFPAGTTFVNGSVKINGAAFPSYNPQTGFALPDLAVGASVTVEFDVKVN